jgi:VanZ family protein
MIRKYPLSVLCIVAIWILSLIPVFPETPLDGVAFIDKWTHLVMYGGTVTVIWWEYSRRHKVYDFRKLFVWGWLMPILMSGVLELLQEYCTGGRRNGDWLDFAANSVGATIGVLLGLMILLYGKSKLRQ